jgi:hypothetical protein
MTSPSTEVAASIRAWRAQTNEADARGANPSRPNAC